jgi:hypothetical protein
MPRWLWWFLVWAPMASSESHSLPSNETLSYHIEWRLITAGKARLEWNAAEPPAHSGGRVNLRVESVGLVSKLFRVEDDYSVNLNSGLCAQSSLLTAREGNRHRETRISFDSERRKADYLERDLVNNTVVLAQQTDIPECVHDLIGGLYLLRTLNLEPGQSTEAPVTDGKKSVMAKIEAQQREDVRTAEGTYHTIRYEIYLFNNVLFHRSAHLNVWLSDDRRRLPIQVRVRMPITIGTITLELDKHE